MEYQQLYEYSGGENGLNLPTSLTQSLEVFRINQREKKLFLAQVTEKETFSGQEYRFQLQSLFGRTVALSTHFDRPDGVLKHKSEFRWNIGENDKIGSLNNNQMNLVFFLIFKGQ